MSKIIQLIKQFPVFLTIIINKIVYGQRLLSPQKFTSLSKKLVVFSSIIIGLLIILPIFIQEKALRDQIEKSLSQKIGSQLRIEKVSVSFFPTVKLKITNASVNLVVKQYQTQINVPFIDISPRIFSIFYGPLAIKEIRLHNVDVSAVFIQSPEQVAAKIAEQSSLTKYNNVEIGFFNKLLDFNDSTKIFDPKNIEYLQVDHGYMLKQDLEGKMNFSEVNFLLHNQLEKERLTISSSFFAEEIPTNLNLVINARSGGDSSLEVKSPIINIVANGNFNQSSLSDLINSNFSGKIEAKIIDLKAILSNYLSKDNLLFRKINASQPIIISSDISNNQGNIKAENILLKSTLINGTGQIAANFSNQTPKIDANFNLSDIDIDKIWFFGAINGGKIIPKNIQEPQNQSLNQEKPDNISKILDPLPVKQGKPLFPNLDLRAAIKINTVKYYEQDLADINLEIASEKGNILLKNLSGKLPGGDLKITGSLDQQNELLNLQGKIDIAGSNLEKTLNWLKISLANLKPSVLGQYNFAANFSSFPHVTFLTDINLSINQGNNLLSGAIKIDNSGEFSASNSNLKINNLNYEEYFLANVGDYYLSPGSMLNKWLWLNTINSENNVNLTFEKLHYNNCDLANQSLNFAFGQGYFRLLDFNSEAPNFNVRGSFDVDISSSKPILNLKIQAKNLQNDDPKQDYYSHFFQLPSLESFNGSIDVSIDNLSLKSWKAQDIEMAGTLGNGIIRFDKFDLKTYQGSLKYKGEIVIKNVKTVNGSIEMLAINNQEFLSNLFNINNIDGVSNLSAAINSSGESKDEFWRNIRGQAKFISSDVVVNKFGVEDLSKQMPYPQKYQNQLSEPLKILYNPETKSSFNKANGQIAFTKKNMHDFNIAVSQNIINGVISGTFGENQDISGTANFIFLSGTLQKPTPVSLAVNFKAKAGEIVNSTNLADVERNLKSYLP